MIFDRTQYRIRALTRRIDNGEDECGKLRAQVEKLKAHPPNWWIKYRDGYGNLIREKVPGNPLSKRDAERYERKRRAEVDEGISVTPKWRKARIKEILQLYLEDKNGTLKSLSSTRTICNHINRHIGNLRLDALDANPRILVKHFQKFPEREWSRKYIWNYAIALKAALNHWIRSHRLHMVNPMNSVKLDPGTRKRLYVPSHEEYGYVLNVARTYGRIPGKKDEDGKEEIPFPDYLAWLLVARWETGLRIGELIPWTWEKIQLDYTPGGDLPYYTTTISKQRQTTEIQVPMSRPLWEMLKSVPGQHERGPVFKTSEGEALKSPPYKSFRRLKKVAKVNYEFHDFRKSVKTSLKAAGFSKEQTKAFQGHATDSMDDYYTIFQRKDLEIMVANSWEGKTEVEPA